MRTVRPAECVPATACPRVTLLSSWACPGPGPRCTFPDHPSPFQCSTQISVNSPAGGLKIDPHLALQPLLQRARAFVVNAAAAHVDGLDLVGRRGADRLIIAVANHEIV